MSKTFCYEDDDGVEHELELPTKWEICSNCNGEGRHVHEALRVVTASEYEEDWDEESWEDRRNGVYDVGCEECDGTGKVQEVDWDLLPEDVATLYARHLDEEAAYRRMCQAERDMGA